MQSNSFNLLVEVSASFQHYLAITNERSIDIIDVSDVAEQLDWRQQPIVFSTHAIRLRYASERAWGRVECIALQERHLWVAMADGIVRCWDWRANRQLRPLRRRSGSFPFKMWTNEARQVHIGVYHEHTRTSTIGVYDIVDGEMRCISTKAGNVWDKYLMAGGYTLTFRHNHLSLWLGKEQCYALPLTRLMVSAATIAKVDADVFVYEALRYAEPELSGRVLLMGLRVRDMTTIKRVFLNMCVMDMVVYRDSLALHVFNYDLHRTGVLFVCRYTMRKLDFVPLQSYWVSNARFTILNKGGTHETLLLQLERNWVKLMKPTWTCHLGALQAFVLAQHRVGQRLPVEVLQLMVQFM
jgi:hypothetical protein